MANEPRGSWIPPIYTSHLCSQSSNNINHPQLEFSFSPDLRRAATFDFSWVGFFFPPPCALILDVTSLWPTLLMASIFVAANHLFPNYTCPVSATVICHLAHKVCSCSTDNTFMQPNYLTHCHIGQPPSETWIFQVPRLVGAPPHFLSQPTQNSVARKRADIRQGPQLPRLVP